MLFPAAPSLMWLVVQILAFSLASTVPWAVEAGEGEPPSIIRDMPTHYSVPIGSKTFKLICPVKADSTLMIEWKKDGEVIGPEWSRFRTSRGDRDLRIRNVMAIDGGRYSCQAVNGFGVRTVDFTLVVYDENAPDGNDDDNDDLPIPVYESPPSWTNPTALRLRTNTPILRRVQSSIELNCPATGNPRPTVRWSKNGLDYGGGFVEAGRPWRLTINHLTRTDSGRYTCLVSNERGQLKASFDVKVTDAENSPPEFDRGDLLNNTAVDGQTATLNCRVRSPYKPFVRWLKQVKEGRRFARNSTIISANGMDLLVLDRYESTTRKQLDDTYLNRLTIPQVTVEHQGVYICVVTNPAGHMVYRSAHLTVVPNLNRYTMLPLETLLPVHLIVSVPIIALLLVFVGYSYYLLQRHHQKRTLPKPPIRYTTSCMLPSSHPPPPRRPPPSLPDLKSPLIRQVVDSRADSYYQQCDPTVCTPLKGCFLDEPHLYDMTFNPLELRWIRPPTSSDEEYDSSDGGYPNGRLQPYPSMYSCR